MADSFEDLQFRGKLWYNAEEVDRKLVALNAILAAMNENWEEVEGLLEAVRKWHEDVEMDPDDRYRLERILEAEA